MIYWTYNIYVDVETGEILKKEQITNKEYIIINTKIEKNETRLHTTIKRTIECRANQRTLW